MSAARSATVGQADPMEDRAVVTPFRMYWRRSIRTPAVVTGLAVVSLLVLIAVAAPLISPHDPLFQDYGAVLEKPSPTHLLGTDNIGRDILSRIIYGSQVSLLVGVVAVGIATVLGIAMGLLSGYFGGWVDDVIMRFSDGMYAFPSLLLVLAIASALGPSISNTMIAIGVVSAPGYARLLRGQVLSLRELDYVTAASALGAGHARIMLRHILPNGFAPLLVAASLSVSGAILTEATLSFLGVGVPPPTPSWGSMLQTGFRYIEMAPWFSLYPGLTIFVVVLGFNILGDGLRTVLDPRIRV
jgi:peptide/nickel transport system permease protein